MRAKFGRGPTVVSKKGSLNFINNFINRCVPTSLKYQIFVWGAKLGIFLKCYNLPFFGWRYGNVDNYSLF